MRDNGNGYCDGDLVMSSKKISRKYEGFVEIIQGSQEQMELESI